jgi:hypothetical protein
VISLAPAVTVRQAQPHGQYGTVEVELELDLPPPDGGPAPAPIRLLLDVASARGEAYPVPADNPVVRFGVLEDDLARWLGAAPTELLRRTAESARDALQRGWGTLRARSHGAPHR